MSAAENTLYSFTVKRRSFVVLLWSQGVHIMRASTLGNSSALWIEAYDLTNYYSPIPVRRGCRFLCGRSYRWLLHLECPWAIFFLFSSLPSLSPDPCLWRVCSSVDTSPDFLWLTGGLWEGKMLVWAHIMPVQCWSLLGLRQWVLVVACCGQDRLLCNLDGA